MDPVSGLALGRIAVGVASLSRPGLVAAQLGQPPSPLLTQWFGTREIALGTLALVARGSARRHLVLVGAAVDAADAVTAYAGARSGAIDRRTGLALTGVAAGAVVAGLLGLAARR